MPGHPRRSADAPKVLLRRGKYARTYGVRADREQFDNARLLEKFDRGMLFGAAPVLRQRRYCVGSGPHAHDGIASAPYARGVSIRALEAILDKASDPKVAVIDRTACISRNETKRRLSSSQRTSRTHLRL